MSAPSIEDREADAVRVLSTRIGNLRKRLLIPLALVSAATAVPSYVLFRELEFAGQWRSGAEVAYHVPLLTGAMAMVPAAILFGLSTLVYRAIRDRRLRAWKTELCREHELHEDQLDNLGRIFH